MNETKQDEVWYDGSESEQKVKTTERVRPNRPSGYIDVTCFNSSGDVVWEEVNHGFNVPSSDETIYRVGLKGFGTPNPADSMGSHQTWREEIGYTGNERPAFNENSAVFKIDAPMQLHGVFVTTGEDKGGTSGLMEGIVNFSTVQSVDAGQTLEVTYA